MAFKFVPYAPEGSGGIIDVPELPTEGIEQDKIYRVVKDTDGSVEVYMATQPVDEWFEDFYKQMAGIDMSVNVVYYVVDTVPENPKAADMAGSNTTIYLYILASTGEPYLQGPAGTAITIPQMMGVGHYAGIVTSVDEMTDGLGIYTIMTESGSSTIYGIPDEANNKTVMEHNGSEWVECGSSAEIKDCACLFADDGGGYASEMRVAEIAALMPLVKQPTRATRMFYGWASKGPEEVDLSKADWSKCTDFKGMFGDNRVIKRVDLSSVDMSGVSSNSSVEDMFDSGNYSLEEVIGVYHNLEKGTRLRATFRGTESSPKPLRRFTFAPDIGLPISCYSEPFNFAYCSFDRDGMVEMFNSLPTTTESGNYAQIKITGNPCVTDGTLTASDRAIATNKGWTLVEV